MTERESGSPHTPIYADEQISTEHYATKHGDEEEGNEVPSQRDLDFIDDEGVSPEERIDFGDDENVVTFEEAEEAKDEMDEKLDGLFGRDTLRNSADAEINTQAENLMAQMEAALEADLEAFSKSMPALNKLRMLKKTEEMFSISRMHEPLMAGGVLGLLKGWLEPMPDGSLPNSKIRTGVLSMLEKLNINCANEDHKEQLKRSGIGKLVMFLSKLPDETAGNRRVAQSLVESWSRPILGYSRPLESGSIQSRDEQAIRAQHRQASRHKDTQDAEPSKHSESRHAIIPTAAALDYTIRPKSKVSMPSKSSRAGKHSEPKLLKKLLKKRK